MTLKISRVYKDSSFEAAINVSLLVDSAFAFVKSLSGGVKAFIELLKKKFIFELFQDPV